MPEMVLMQAVCEHCGATNLGLQKRCLLCDEKLENLQPMDTDAEADTLIATSGSPGTSYCVQVLNGQLMGQRFPLNEGVNIGVNPQNDIVLPDRLVSRRHARIERQGNGYVLIDLGSTNGTYVNDMVHRLTSPVRLVVGNVVTLGITRLRVEFEE